MHLLTNFLSIPIIFRNWTNMSYTVDNTVDNIVICVIMLLAISYVHKVNIKLTKQYINTQSLSLKQWGILTLTCLQFSMTYRNYI